jgi:CHASE3 domain sensor protein
VLVTAGDLERFVVDLESGERGYALTHDESFLQPWTAAVKAIPASSRALNRLAAVPAQHARALRITNAVASYVRDDSVPTVDAARRGDPSPAVAALVTAGKSRVESLRAQFRGLVAAPSCRRRLRIASRKRRLSSMTTTRSATVWDSGDM